MPGRTNKRSAAAGALVASENRLRLALEATDACAWEFDPASGLSTWDGASEALLGLTGTLPMQAAFARVIHPADLSELLAAIADALDPAGNGRFQVEHRVIGPSGPRWFQSLGRSRFAASGGTPPQAERLICVTRDINERRGAEERHARLVAELNHRVKNTLANVLALVEQTRRSADARSHAAPKDGTSRKAAFRDGAPDRRRFQCDL